MNDLPIVLGIILLSMVVQSTFSFGGALVALPLLVTAVDVKSATVLMTMLSCTIAAAIVFRNRPDVDVPNAWRLIVSACVGIPFGILFLGQAKGTLLITGLALTVIGFTILSLYSVKTTRLANPNYAYIFGLTSGLFGGAYNISGPPVVLFGSLSNWPSDRFRATIQSYALFTNAFAILGHAIAGNVTRATVTYYVLALPIIGLAVWLGNIIHQRIPGERYAVVVKVLLVILGLRLLAVTVM